MTETEMSGNLKTEPLWSCVRKLTALNWAITVSGFKRAGTGRKLLYLGLMVLVALLVVGTFLLTTYLLGVINTTIATQSGTALDAFVDSVPGLMISGAFLGILVCSFAVLLQALYLANDMDFLLSAPVPIRAVFLSKLLQAVVPNLVLVSAICMPILFGLGVTEGYSLLYFPVVIALLVSIALAAAGISSLLVMVVVRYIPAKRVAEVLGFLAAVFFIVLSQWSNLTGISADSITPGELSRSTEAISQLNQGWSPVAWAGRGLVALGQGYFLPGALQILAILASCAVVFWLSLVAAERMYYSGWATMQVSAQRQKVHITADHRPVEGALSKIIGKLLPPQVSGLMLKDFRMIQRDLRNTSKVILPMIMGIVFAVMLLRGRFVPSQAGSVTPAGIDVVLRSVYAYGSMLVPLFVGWMLVTNLATISFSMEGRYYWILKAAPLSSRKLLAVKFLTTYLPSLLITWMYIVAIAFAQHVPLKILAYGLPSAALVLAGMVGINLAIGVRFANMSWTDPRHMTDGAGTYLAMIAGIAYLVLCYIIFIAPPAALPMLGATEGTGRLAGLLVGGAIVTMCMLLPLRHAERAIAQLGEE